MKRLHVHVCVPELNAAVEYYARLFDAEPTTLKPDYAKWSLAEPSVNFAISSSSRREDGATEGGVQHLGIEVDGETALAEVTARLQDAGAPSAAESDATCCYARSEKTWSHDPAGVVWETFYTHGESAVYGNSAPAMAAPQAPAKDEPASARATGCRAGG